MEERDPELDDRLALLHGLAEPPPAEKQRLLIALRASLQAVASTPSEAVAPRSAAGRAPGHPANARRRLAPWLGGACVGAGLALVIGFVGFRLSGSPPLEPAAAAGTVRGAAPPSPHTTGVAAVGGAGVLPEAAVPLDLAVPLELADALARLHRAERALHAGDATLALDVLSSLDRRAAPALLREERLVTRALALCQAQRLQEALDTRRALEREFVGSIYTARLEQSCAVEREHP